MLKLVSLQFKEWVMSVMSRAYFASSFCFLATVLTMAWPSHAELSGQAQEARGEAFPRTTTAFSTSVEQVRATQSFELVSRIVGTPPTENGPNRSSLGSSISADGRFIAFDSTATNLVTGDSNGRISDIFVFDRDTQSVELLTGGGNSGSGQPSISADGRFVAFVSNATNLVDGDGNNRSDIFVYDRETDTTELVIQGDNSDGSTSPSISGDGRYVAFEIIDTEGDGGTTVGPRRDIVLYDRETGTAETLTADGNESSLNPSLNFDGRFLAFSSRSNNLDSSGAVGRIGGIFVFDRETNNTQLLTPGADRFSLTPSISADGQFIAFSSSASTIAEDSDTRSDTFVYNRNTGVTELLPRDPTVENSFSRESVISADGRFVAYAIRNARTFSNFETDVVLYDRDTQTLEVIDSGANSSGIFISISGDGQLVGFASSADNLLPSDLNESRDVFLYDRAAGDLARVPSIDLSFEVAGANSPSRAAAISGNGRLVAFESAASNLTDGTQSFGTDVYVYNRDTELSSILSFDLDRQSSNPSISSDGGIVAFQSGIDNTGVANPNGQIDIYVHVRDTDDLENITSGGDEVSINAAVSANGRFVAFESHASNLVVDDANGNTSDIFLYDTESSSVEVLTAGGNGDSQTPSISADGRFVAFASLANNLAAGVTASDRFNIFVYDQLTGNTELLTEEGNNSSLEPAISGDGRLVAFASSATNLAEGDTNGAAQDIFVYDRESASTLLITPGANSSSSSVSISGDGRLVAFASEASNLVANDLNLIADIFVHNLETNATDLLVVNAEESSSAPSLSDNGRALAFTSLALNIANDGTPLFSDVFVSDTNASPLADALTVSTNEDSPVTFTVTGSDPELDAFTFELITQPANGTVTGTAPDFTYTPDSDFFGTDSFTFAANDGGGGGPGEPASVIVNVASVNDAPVAIGTDASGTVLTTPEGTPFAITLTGTDIEGDTLTYAVTVGPSNGTLSGTAPNLTYTPATNFGGSDTFSFTVSDGALTSVPAAISLAVTSANAPTAVPQSLTTTINTSTSITLVGTDPDGTSLGFSISDFPANGRLSGDLPNVTYTPNSEFAGVDSFSFTVNDGTSTSAPANVSITVAAANDPSPGNNAPVASGQSVSLPQDTATSIVLTGSDADGDSLSFDFVTLPANGSLAGTPPNLIYTPDTSYIGPDSFSFTVSDAQDTSGVAAVSISVVEASVTLFSAVLPASRSVEVGATATAFATLINAGSVAAQACVVRLPDTVPASFFFQASDPTTNLVIGQPDLAVDIPAGAAQSFVFGITPTEELSATQVALEFQCANASDAASFAGLNTLLLSASFAPVPDLIALAATTSDNGVMELRNNSGFFTAATINVGSAASITVTADTGATVLPMTLSLCQTDPTTSECINPTVPSTEPVIVEIAEGATPTFAVFASADETIALDPASSRVFLRLSDASGEVRGATSVAVETTP